MSERKHTGNALLQCRVKPSGAEWVGAACGELGVSRSDLLRYALSYAAVSGDGFVRFVRSQQG